MRTDASAPQVSHLFPQGMQLAQDFVHLTALRLLLGPPEIDGAVGIESRVLRLVEIIESSFMSPGRELANVDTPAAQHLVLRLEVLDQIYVAVLDEPVRCQRTAVI